MYFYFKTLRATYNRAIKDKFARRNNNPFPEYNLSRFSTKTKKRALSKDDMRKIIKLDCSERKNITQLAHDIFTFSYYCGGISFVDVANLTPINIVDGRLHYIRQKTYGEINLCLMKEAQNHYLCCSAYICYCAKKIWRGHWNNFAVAWTPRHTNDSDLS